MKTDISHLKKIWTPKKDKDIDNMENKIRNLNYELEVIKM